MKIVPEFLKKIFGDVDALSVYNFLKDFLRDFRRVGAPAKEEGSSGGMSSLKDEQEYNLLLEEIQEEDNRSTHGQGDRIVEALDGFYRFLFPTGGFIAWMHEWVWGTRYRMFITTLPVTPGKPGTPAKAATRRTAAVQAVPATPGKDTRKIFLRWMADIILSETDRDAGYRKLLAVLKNRQVPTGIQLPDGWFNNFGAFMSEVWTTAHDLTEPANIQAVEMAVRNSLTTARRGTLRVLGIVAIIVTLLMAVVTYVNLTGGVL